MKHHKLNKSHRILFILPTKSNIPIPFPNRISSSTSFFIQKFWIHYIYLFLMTRTTFKFIFAKPSPFFIVLIIFVLILRCFLFYYKFNTSFSNFKLFAAERDVFLTVNIKTFSIICINPLNLEYKLQQYYILEIVCYF